MIRAYEIVIDEFMSFLDDINSGALTFGKYVHEFDYKDNYAQDEIVFAQYQFYNLVSAYLRYIDGTEYVIKLDSNDVRIIKNVEKWGNNVDWKIYKSNTGS